MTKYYIRITEEIPEDGYEGLWFEWDSNGKLLIVNDSEYTTLKSEFDDAVEGLENYLEDNEGIQTIVANIVESGNYRLENCDNATYLVEGGNTGNAYTYTSLKNKLDGIDEELGDFESAYESNKEYVLGTLSSHITSISSVEEILSGLSWSKTGDLAYNGKEYENVAYYNSMFVYLPISIPSNVVGKGNGGWKKITTISLIDGNVDLLPLHRQIAEANNHVSLMLHSNGDLYMMYDKDKTASDTFCTFLYPLKRSLS